MTLSANCKYCEKPFMVHALNQLYCSPRCKCGAERKRRRERASLTTRQPITGEPEWYRVLFNPSAEALLELAPTYVADVNSSLPPTKLVGTLPNVKLPFGCEIIEAYGETFKLLVGMDALTRAQAAMREGI